MSVFVSNSKPSEKLKSVALEDGSIWNVFSRRPTNKRNAWSRSGRQFTDEAINLPFCRSHQAGHASIDVISHSPLGCRCLTLPLRSVNVFPGVKGPNSRKRQLAKLLHTWLTLSPTTGPCQNLYIPPRKTDSKGFHFAPQALEPSGERRGSRISCSPTGGFRD